MALSGIDVVWLKKDVRLHDHAPIAAAAGSGRRFALLYIYEPGQVTPQPFAVAVILDSLLIRKSDKLPERVEVPGPPHVARRRSLCVRTGSIHRSGS